MKTNRYGRPYLKLIFLFFLCTLINRSFLAAQPVDVPIFRDDFNGSTIGASWQADPSWSIMKGSAYNFIDGINGKLKTATAYQQASFIIETAAKGFTTNYFREFRLTFGQASLANDALYQLKYTGYAGARLSLSRSENNIYNPVVLDEVGVFPELNLSQWYKFMIARYKSGLIQVYMDKGAGYGSIPILEAIDSSYENLGHTGWHVSTETSPEAFFIDYISAVKPGLEKPAIREKPVKDDLITQVSAKSGEAYTVSKLNVGVKQLIDRSYTITSVPNHLEGASFIQTANDDKFNSGADFLSFFLTTDAVVYIAYDPRGKAIPAWLTRWTKTGDKIGTSDKDVNYLDVYSRIIQSEERFYPVILGGNLASPAVGARTNYLVAAIKRPPSKQLQAEDALLSGAVVANNHPNYNGTGFADFKNPSKDYIEWTVPIDVPGTYNLGFTFANAGSTDRSLQVTDNGVSKGTATFNHVSPSWSAWAFLSGPNVFLSAGIHKIRVTATGTSGPNMDELSLTFLYPFAQAAPATSFTLPGLIYNTPPAKDAYAYPNPLLQSTHIFYNVKAKAKVSLSIYTIQGQQVQLLENGFREAGNYKATFNAANLGDGVYVYRLQIGKEVQTGRLLKY